MTHPQMEQEKMSSQSESVVTQQWLAEVAEVLGVSKRTFESEWTMIKAWMRRELSEMSDS